jgi:hypothetical protein
MVIRCPECDGKLKVPESTAGKKVKCPACHGVIVIPHPDVEANDDAADEYRVLTTKAPAHSAADEPVSPLPRKKSKRGGEKKKKRPATVMDPRLVAGLGAAAVLLVAGVVWLVVRGFSGGAAGAGGAGGGAPAVTGGAVVFSEPLADIPAPPKWNPPPFEMPKPPAAIALLPDASGANSLTGGQAGSWEGRPDPAESASDPLPGNAMVHLRNQEVPLMASLQGPFVLEHRGNLSEQAARAKVGDEDPLSPNSALLVKDLRTGKVAGKFSWMAPVWTAVRLSPDARYLVGPDNRPGAPATSQDGLLFVWERDKPEPVCRLKMPGPVIWIDFVAPDKIAALSFEKKDGEGLPSHAPVLVVWNATTPEPEQSVALPEGEFTPPQQDPYTYRPATPESKTYFPDPVIGAVSPGGKYVALAGATAIQIVSIPDGKLTGGLHVPRTQIWPRSEPRAHTYHGLGFSESGDKLYGLLKTFGPWLVTWSMASGQLTSVASLPVPEVRGPPLPGPEPNTVIIPVWAFDDGYVVKELMTPKGRPFSTAAVIDVRTGAVVAPITSRPLRRNGEGIVTLSSLKFEQDLPLPELPGIKLDALSDNDKQRLREAWVVRVAAMDSEAIRKGLAAQSDVGLPPARPGDRTGLAVSSPSPPKEWKPPARPAQAAEKLIGAYNVPNTAPMYGEAHVGFLAGYLLPDDPKETEKLRFEARAGKKAAIDKLNAAAAKAVPGIYWLRYDLRTGRLLDPPVRLGSHKAFSPGGVFDPSAAPLAAGMTHDGTRLALRHPTDLARVDVWDSTGTLLLSIIPYPPALPVQWVGWSAGGRLLTMAGGKLTAWNVPDGKAAYEVEGDYQLPVCPVRGGAWVAIAANSGVDLVDTESGRCLGHFAGEPDDRYASHPADLAISRDGSALAYVAPRKKPDPEGGAVFQAWDLASGKLLLRTPMGVPIRPMVVLDSRYVLLGGASLFDLKTQLGFAGYQTDRFHSPDYMPFPEGPLPGSPDGRIWAFGPEPGAEDSGRGMLRPLELPGYATAYGDRASVFDKQTPLLVEVDMGEEGRSRSFGKNLLKSLQSDGFTIGKGGWTLRASCEVKPTDLNLKFKGGWGGVVNVPRVLVHIKLYAPDGELAHTTGSTVEMGTGSKYFRGERKVSEKWERGEKITELEFTWDLPDQNPREAIVTELLDNLAKRGELRLVPSVVKFQGKYQLPPAVTDVAFVPVPPPAAAK